MVEEKFRFILKDNPELGLGDVYLEGAYGNSVPSVISLVEYLPEVTTLEAYSKEEVSKVYNLDGFHSVPENVTTWKDTFELLSGTTSKPPLVRGEIVTAVRINVEGTIGSIIVNSLYDDVSQVAKRVFNTMAKRQDKFPGTLEWSHSGRGFDNIHLEPYFRIGSLEGMTNDLRNSDIEGVTGIYFVAPSTAYTEDIVEVFKNECD